MNTQYNSSYIFSITLVATLGGLLGDAANLLI